VLFVHWVLVTIFINQRYLLKFYSMINFYLFKFYYASVVSGLEHNKFR
jgi:hypothetical protein